MPSPEIRTFKNLEDLSRGAADDLVTLATGGRGRIFAAALSGGSTPKRFYELLATPEFSSRLPWPSIHLFQVDERSVQPDDPRSNYKMIREAMLDELPGRHFHRMRAEPSELAEREQAARDYEAELRATLGTPPGDCPRLDVIYLGLGEDGHTASLFPGTTALHERTRAVCANYVPKLSMYRMTLTLPVLNAAARVIFLVSGADKAERIRQVLKPTSTEAPILPAQLVQPNDGSVAWYVDEAAAQLL